MVGRFKKNLISIDIINIQKEEINMNRVKQMNKKVLQLICPLPSDLLAGIMAKNTQSRMPLKVDRVHSVDGVISEGVDGALDQLVDAQDDRAEREDQNVPEDDPATVER